MSTIRFDPLSLQVEVEGVETAWKLECFPNGKQKIGLNILLHFYDFTWEIRGGHRWCSLRLLVPRQHKRHQQTVQLCYRVGRFTLRRCIGIFYPDRFVNEECSRVMKGKGDHCFRDNQNGWGWLKLVTHQTLRSVLCKVLCTETDHCLSTDLPTTSYYRVTAWTYCVLWNSEVGQERLFSIIWFDIQAAR